MPVRFSPLRRGRSAMRLLAALALLTPALAEPPPTPQPEPMTLDAAVAEALARDPRLSAAEQALARLTADASAAGALPSATLELVPLWSDDRQLDLDASLQQVLFDPAISPNRRAARVAVVGAQLAVRQARLAVAAEARGAWLTLLAAQRQVAVAAELVAVAETLRQAAAVARDIGERPGVHVLHAELELARAQQDLSTRRAEAATARLALAALLVRDSASLLADDAWPEPQALPPDTPALLAAHPALRADELAVQAARRGIDRVRAEVWPTVTAGLFRDDGEHGVTVGVALPLFDLGGRRSRQRSAEAAVREAEAQVLVRRRELQLAFEQAKVALDAAVEAQAAWQAEVLARAERLVELARIGYETGAMDLLDVLDAQRRLAEARQGAVERELAVALAQADLARSLGLGLPAPAPTASTAEVLP